MTLGRYDSTYNASIDDPAAFWLGAADLLDWKEPPTIGLDSTRAPFHRWFPDGTLNICHNAVDRHVAAGRGDHTAIAYHSPVTDTVREITYDELLDSVARLAGALIEQGVTRGDRVVIYMPMVPEAVVAMLACARIGTVHSVVFGGFAARELALRIDDATPKIVITASCGIEGQKVIEYKPLLDAALDIATHTPHACIVAQRPQAPAHLRDTDIDWDTALADAAPAPAVPVASTDPLYILYTSGTTGKPKGVVRDTGGYATALAWSMKNIYDVGIGETMFTASDVGWVVGHSYIVYAPLIAGATTVLYEGKPVGTPDAAQFWRVIEHHRVKTMFTAPTALRAVRKADPDGALSNDHDLTSLQYLFLAGERLDPETYQWATELLDVPVIDNWWQTETGWPIAANPAGLELLPLKPGSPTRPVPGWHVKVVDRDGQPVPAGEDGAIVVELPMPPGALTTLWNDDDRFLESYMSAFPNTYLTGDGGRIDEDGYLFVMGRTDEVINVAGHRLSTGAIEEALARHPRVAECAVIGVSDSLKGQVPRGFVVLKDSAEATDRTLTAELLALVRENVGPIASLKDVTVVSALPKTRSGKILRKTMRNLADGIDEPIPSTIENPDVLADITGALRA